MIERAKERFPLIRPLLIPVLLYIGLLAWSLNWLQSHPDSAWRYLVALAPMLPGIFIALGILRAIRRLDELAQKILLEGMSVSFFFTLILTLSLGLLSMAGLPQPNTVYISLFMVVMWLAGKLFFSGKYQ
jgi:hypothetical protein